MKTVCGILMLAILSLTIYSCGKDEAKEADLEYFKDSAFGTVDMSGSAADDASDGETTFFTDKAGSCTWTFANNADNTCTRSMDCTVDSTRTMVGSVVLTFNTSADGTDSTTNGNCLLSNTEYVTRTASFTFTGPLLTMESTSESHDDYTGSSVSGGIKVTRNSSSDYEMNILGMTRIWKWNSSGTELRNFSIKTTTPLSLNKVLKEGREISAGTVQTIHNLGEFTATHEISETLVWPSDGSCCMPTSGKVTTTFSGSLTGTGSVTFNSTCGSITVTKEDESKTYSVSENRCMR